jgi:integrase
MFGLVQKIVGAFVGAWGLLGWGLFVAWGLSGESDMLTDKQIKALKPQDKPFKVADGGGLSLAVMPSGGLLWLLKFRIGGKEKKLSLGPYPTVTLGEARRRRDEARRLLSQGIDPAAAKQAAKAASKTQQEGTKPPTFAQAFEAWLQWRGKALIAQTQASIDSAMRRHVLPQIGDMEMDSITPLEIKKILSSVDDSGHGDLARRLFQRMGAIWRYAITHGLCKNNPMISLRPAEIFTEMKVEHRKYIGADELPELFKRMGDYPGSPVVIKALQFLILTATRPGETRGARWGEFNMDKREWRIPAERMKMKTEHIVPLSDQAMNLIQELRAFGLHNDIVFPSLSRPNQNISDMTLNSALSRMGYKDKVTAHGFRSTFSTWANEAGIHPDIIELQLAHIERNKVRAAYNRALRLSERVELMRAWGLVVEKASREGAGLSHDTRDR